MTVEGIDYSDARPGGAYIASHGKHFAVRYLYPPVAGGKGLSASEVRDLQAHHIDIVLVFEGTAGGAANGRSQGVKDAKAALALLKALPLDQDLPIYFAVDFDPTLGEWGAIDSYFSGVTSVLPHARAGVYGGYATVTRLQKTKAVAWFWQTYAWSGGRLASGIHLYQYSNGEWGGSVDFTRALQAEYGQHRPAAPAPPPAPTPPPTPTPVPVPPPVTPAPDEGDDMASPCYFKGDKAADVFILNRLTGKKRHVPAPEWAAANVGSLIITIPQADADAIPAGA